MSLNPATLKTGDKIRENGGSITATIHHVCAGTVYIHEEDGRVASEVRSIMPRCWTLIESNGQIKTARDLVGAGKFAEVTLYSYYGACPGESYRESYEGSFVERFQVTAGTAEAVRRVLRNRTDLKPGEYRAVVFYNDGDVSTFQFTVAQAKPVNPPVEVSFK